MSISFLYFFLVIFFLVPRLYGRKTRSSSHFGYTDTELWATRYPDCGGNRQSPIDLNTDDLKSLETTPFEWNGYDTIPTKMTITNNGHTVQVTANWDDNDDIAYICGGALDGDYLFLQLHFHWGPTNNVGSEHTVDGRSYPLEMHMVHYKRDYGSPQEAMKYEDGLAAVGIFFKVGAETEGIFNIEKYMRKIEPDGSKMEIKPFPLSAFDLNFPEYYTYSGSLTTPPCSEIVTWTIAIEHRCLSNDQLDLFRNIQLDDDGDRNFRPTQPLNGRSVFCF